MQGSNINNQLRPPVNDPIAGNLMLSDIWLRYFNYLYQTLLTPLQYGISVPSLTTSQRDSNAAYAQQRLIMNTDTSELQINIGNTWYKVGLTAA